MNNKFILPVLAVVAAAPKPERLNLYADAVGLGQYEQDRLTHERSNSNSV